jgi:hypothetical protein
MPAVGEVVVDDYVVEERSLLDSLHKENRCFEQKLVVLSAWRGVASIADEVDFCVITTIPFLVLQESLGGPPHYATRDEVRPYSDMDPGFAPMAKLRVNNPLR